MSASNINSVTITGNLTRDPELRNLPSGTSVCDLRVAVNSSRKDPQSGQWIDKPNYFDVTVFGGQAESCARYLGKGRPVAVQGRLDWSEWTTQQNEKRSKVAIIADTVQFLGSPDGQQPAAGQQPQQQYQQPPAQPQYQQPAPQPQAPQQPVAPQPQYQQPPAQPQAAPQPQFQAPAPQPQPMAPAGQMPPAPMPQSAQMPPAPVAAPGGPVASPDIPF